jgi:DNA-binding Lrp family transcriptional regulator
MIVETVAQKETLDAIKAIIAEQGRGTTIREVAEKMGRSESSVHRIVTRLVEIGVIQKGHRGLIPTSPGVQHTNEGWTAAVEHLRKEVGLVLIQFHAGKAIIEAVDQVMDEAAEGAK